MPGLYHTLCWLMEKIALHLGTGLNVINHSKSLLRAFGTHGVRSQTHLRHDNVRLRPQGPSLIFSISFTLILTLVATPCFLPAFLFSFLFDVLETTGIMISFTMLITATFVKHSVLVLERV